MKALIVKDDGLIYAGEVPEELIHDVPPFHSFAWHEHKFKLTSAKDSAIRCADQEKAKELIWKYGDQYNKPVVKPGLVVLIDGLEWEVWEENDYTGLIIEKINGESKWSGEPKIKQVAILKESIPKITIEDVIKLKNQLGEPGISEIKIVENSVLPDNMVVVSSYLFKRLKS